MTPQSHGAFRRLRGEPDTSVPLPAVYDPPALDALQDLGVGLQHQKKPGHEPGVLPYIGAYEGCNFMHWCQVREKSLCWVSLRPAEKGAWALPAGPQPRPGTSLRPATWGAEALPAWPQPNSGERSARRRKPATKLECLARLQDPPRPHPNPPADAVVWEGVH
jgi:hypothetical protein